jgi:phosphatidylserine decarboxylase
MRDPIDSYRNLSEFFARPLKDGVRPIADGDLVSPTDATLTVYGKVDDNSQIDQVKGLSYPAAPFLGFERMPQGNFYYCVLYLAPGDYHRFHAPTDTSFFRLTHIAGQLFPVAKYATTRVPNLFCRNERAVLWGSWKHGMFSMTPVGAYNVGSITITDKVRAAFDARDFVTNSPHRDVGVFSSYTRKPVTCQKGEEVGGFQLGSTVVLVFEVPEKSSFEFSVPLGSRIRVGEPLGQVVKSQSAAARSSSISPPLSPISSISPRSPQDLSPPSTSSSDDEATTPLSDEGVNHTKN